MACISEQRYGMLWLTIQGFQKVSDSRGQKHELAGSAGVAESLGRVAQDCFLSFIQASKYLSLTELTLRKLLPENKHYRVGAKMLIRKADLDRWIELRSVKSDEIKFGRIADEV
jgi:excisionase family DNA binding protein